MVPRLDLPSQLPHVEEKQHVLKTVVGMKRRNDFGDGELFSQIFFFVYFAGLDGSNAAHGYVQT